MNPILFAENATTFNTNGIGRLSDAISCVVTEERNGQYELEMEYPKSGKHYSSIGIRSLIVVKASVKESELQAFRVYSITKPIGGKVTIYAQHISYDLSKNVSMPFSVVASASACAIVLSRLKSNAVENCPFNFSTDVTTVASYNQLTPASIRQRLGGVEGSVLDQFGGEYEWNNFTVYLRKNRGTEKDITLRYGKNITDLKQEENIANTITGVVPFWINTDKTETVTLPERAVYTQNASRYSSKLTIPLDLSTEFEEKPTEEQLRTKAQIYVNKEGMGLPKVSIKLSFVDLSQTEEYKEILPLQQVNLCDTIKVQFEELGIDTTAKVVETEYDVLGERYNSIQVGSLKSTLAMTINDMNASMATSIQETGERVYADVNMDVSDMVDNATKWLTSSGGYVIAIKNDDGTWKELIFASSTDVSASSTNILRINENGIGFSRTGIGGPYYQGWTIDGRLLIGGSNASGLTVYKQKNNKTDTLLNIYQDANGDSYMTWNTKNASMDSSGLITAVNMTLTGGQLYLGKKNAGKIEMYDENEKLRGVWSKTEFVLYDGNGTYDSNILFRANSDGAVVRGSLKTGKFNVEGDYIKYDDNNYIDMTGFPGMQGIHLNADRVVFSANRVGITTYRDSNVVFFGKEDGHTASIEYDSVSNVVTDLSNDGDYWSWNNVTIPYVSGFSAAPVVNGLVVE